MRVKKTAILRIDWYCFGGIIPSVGIRENPSGSFFPDILQGIRECVIPAVIFHCAFSLFKAFANGSNMEEKLLQPGSYAS